MEPRKQRRQECSSETGDRISSLPESIISHILSLLPTKSAVATSFLSNSWKFRWTKVSVLDFDDRSWSNRERSELGKLNFVEFVNKVFATHIECFRKLRLRWHAQNIHPVYLDIWLNAAIARNIRVLDLGTLPRPGTKCLLSNHTDENYEFHLPAALYTCGTLEVLKLRGPFMVKLPRVAYLPKLRDLELICVKYECDESVEKLLSACPVLHSFKIERQHYHGNLIVCKISSSSLKRLLVYFYEGCQCARFDLKLVIDTPALEYLVVDCPAIKEFSCIQDSLLVDEVYINVFISNSFPQGIDVAKLVQACSGVKNMDLGYKGMMSLGHGTAEVKMPANFGNLTKLVAEFSRWQWSCLLDLIDRSVNLEVLRISAWDMLYVEEEEAFLDRHGGSFWRRPERVPQCLSSSLKHVYFLSFDGYEDEMAMLKYILDHGLLIETVTLCSNPIDDTEKLNIVKEVLMFRRASAACAISFS